ncbi:MAG: 16S rRNA (cytidine(1402)-2'-O)-methyltransferase [Firmicutes bacterium]|nr:16S rRNA (cytidine(1402)-2'-O)-methyltransferase [Bacillota bacterium]
MSQKSYNNTPTLYLIPTPIGNMEDITLRAINALKEVEVIFSEDTRVTGILLKHLDIKKKLIANHEHNEQKNCEIALSYLKDGYNIGLVTDRGTPIISDPGYGIAKFIIEHGYNVVGLPGPTALIPALIVSGLNPSPFLFYGFLNNKEQKRIKELESLKNIKATLIFYEAPHRLEKTLDNMLKVLGNRNISISREISKRYEEVYRGQIDDIKKQIVDAKGEFVIVVDGDNTIKTYDNLTIDEHINLYLAEDMKLMDAIKKVAKERNVSKSDIYNEYHKR